MKVTVNKSQQSMQRELQSIYGSLSSPKDSLPGNLNELQPELFAALLDDGHLTAYPPSTEYQRAFWRHVILSIEMSGNVSECAPLTRWFNDVSRIALAPQEVDQCIYDHYIEVLRLSTSVKPLVYVVHVLRFFPLWCSSQLNAFSLSSPSPSYMTYLMRRPPLGVKEDDRVTLLESRTTIEAGTTGMRTWQASLMLGEWLLCNPGMLGYSLNGTPALTSNRRGKGKARFGAWLRRRLPGYIDCQDPRRAPSSHIALPNCYNVRHRRQCLGPMQAELSASG